ncbi:MAG: rhamnulokinase family protein [Bryobacteraceae bacterium]
MSFRYLALDLGAESGRSMLAELADHKLSLTELHRFANIPVRLPNGLYWDTFRLFYDICEGIRASGKATDHLDGIAVDTWGVDFGLIGADGSIVECPRHYRDARTQGTPEQVFAKVPRSEIFQQTGIQSMEINSLYQLFALQRDAPSALQRASKLLFMPDLFNYFLTGAYACERTIASTSQFYDPVKRTFATDMLRKLGIHASFFAELVDPGAQLGPLLPQVAEQCGLRRDAMVYATGSHDTASAVAAAPVVDDGHWCYISSGTWSLMGVETDQPVINEESLRANFTNEVGVRGTIRLLKNIAGLWILQECRRAWARAGQDYTYAELMERAAATKPIQTVIDPDDFLLPGNHPEQIREFCRKSGQEVPADAGSMAFVILQSLAVRYKEVLDILERLTGRSIRTIHIVGGGSRNRLLNQLAANRTGRKVVAGPVEATAAGNALTQAMGNGDVSSLRELRAIVRRSFEVEEFLPA